MSKLPTVAIIGRPNTGKSTLFNRIVGSRRAIESPVPGTTRDLISQRVDLETVSFLLIDTGGIGASRDKDFEKDVASQSALALDFADVVLFTVNSREEVTADDRKVIELIRKKRRKHVPVIVILTKADDPGSEDAVKLNYQELNIGDSLVVVSAPHRLGIDELLANIAAELKKLNFVREEKLPDPSVDDSEEIENLDDDSDDIEDAEIASEVPVRTPRIAIIGKPNVGKSSIVNALMSDTDRKKSPLLVSPIAGTTRDSTDTEVTYQGRPYVLVDTAGLKKNARNLDEIERYSAMRTIKAVEDADIVVLVLSAEEQPTQQDKRIASLAAESGKGLIILLNKIDTMKGQKREKAVEYVTAVLQFVSKFAKIIPCSAVTREGLVKLFDVVATVQQSRVRRISTRELHRWFERTVHGQPLGEVGKAKHITQAKDLPPTFVLFVKNPKRVSVSQLRHLENRLRETFGFDGSPIRWVLKAVEKDEKKRKILR